jgi:hypothetical protein
MAVRSVHRVSSQGHQSRLLVAALVLLALVAGPRPVLAQIGGMGGIGGGGFRGGIGGGFGAVGGISIDAEGIVRNADARALEALAAERRKALADGAGLAAGKLRKVSLVAVVAEVRAAAKEGRQVSLEASLLGGLERVTHVFADPEKQDIVLAGPADRIVVDARGNLVAAGSRRPTLQLEDLIVALRTIDQARAGGIQCSIDPTREGMTNYERLMAGLKTMPADKEQLFRQMETAVGSQVVTVRGVPGDSRFARVLVAADYRMKRIGMGLDPSGVAELPSYLALVPAAGKAAMLPRFWLEAEYEPLAHDADELSWRFGGRKMKCLSESDLLAKDGVQRGAGRADAAAEKWCAAMTANYDALAAKQPVFGELLNCIDMAVVAAIIHGRQLDRRAGLDLAPLLDGKTVPLPVYDVPARVPTVATGLKKGSNWVLSVSGGVQFQPWQFAANGALAADAAEARTLALGGRPARGVFWD